MRIRAIAATAVAAVAVGAAIADGATGPTIFTIAGGEAGAFAGDGKPATTAALNGPAGIVMSGPNVLVADTLNQRVRQIAANGVISTVAGSGDRGSADGAPASAKFQDPTGLAIGGPGLLVADSANSQVRAVALPGGAVTTIAGSGESGFSGDGGPARSALLNEPAGVAVVGDRIFVADTGNNRIRAIEKDGTIHTIAGTGTAGFAGDGGPAAAAQLNRPAGLAVGSAGLLVADSGNNRIRVIRADGSIGTVAGTGAASSGGDGGPATAAAVNRPLDVAANGSELFIAETGGNRVRHVDAAGVISRLAGAGGPRYGGDGGAPATALLNAPRAVEVGPGGDLLVADSDNNRIRYVAVPRAAGSDGTDPLLALAPRPATLLAPLKKVVKVVNRRKTGSLVVKDVKLGYTLSTGARVTFVVRKNKTTRTILKFTRPGGPGLNRLSLPKTLRVGKKRLNKGFYTVTLTAKDTLGRVAVKKIALTVR